MSIKRILYTSATILILIGIFVASFYWGKDVGYKMGDEAGYDRGYQSGNIKGYDTGLAAGYEKGSKDGYGKGVEQAESKLRDDIYKTAYNKGYDDAVTASRQEGFVYPSGRSR